MNILAVDTAGKTAGVALLQDDRLLYEVYLDAGMTHSETLMPRQLYRPAHRSGRCQRPGLPPGDAVRAGFHAGSTGSGPHRRGHGALCTGCPPRAGVQRCV